MALNVREAVGGLLSWYQPERRHVPWRMQALRSVPIKPWLAPVGQPRTDQDVPQALASQEPASQAQRIYEILLGEVMSQQTRMDVVVKYHRAFLTRWPTLDDMAKAPLDDVLAAWQGLGYYRRARMLHQSIARLHQTLHNDPQRIAGNVDEGVDVDGGDGDGGGVGDWLGQLPGIGPYSRSCIGSMVYGEALAAIDGNVRRVLGRWAGIVGSGPAFDRSIQSVANAWMEACNPLNAPILNQAWMDLSFLVCKPRSPHCDQCPLASSCMARATGVGIQGLSPGRKAPQAPKIDVADAVCVIRKGHCLMVMRRTGLLKGLWGLVWGEWGGSQETSLIRHFAPNIKTDKGIDVAHQLSGCKLTLRVHRVMWKDVVRAARGEIDACIQAGDAQWVGLDALDACATSRLVRKALDALEPANTNT